MAVLPSTRLFLSAISCRRCRACHFRLSGAARGQCTTPMMQSTVRRWKRSYSIRTPGVHPFENFFPLCERPQMRWQYASSASLLGSKQRWPFSRMRPMMYAACCAISSRVWTKLVVKVPCGAFCMNRFGNPLMYWKSPSWDLMLMRGSMEKECACQRPPTTYIQMRARRCLAQTQPPEECNIVLGKVRVCIFQWFLRKMENRWRVSI